MAISKEKKKQLDSMMGKINKRFGEGTINTVGAIQDKLKQEYLLTASTVFNQMLYGGLCKGRIIELFGPNSSGKTSLAIETIKTNQDADPDFVAGWLETENSVTQEILAAHGIDMDRLVYWNQEDAGNAENALDVYRSVVSSGAVNMIVVNSIAGLVPKTEVVEELDKNQMALVARLMSKFFRVVTGPAAKNGITQIFINQIRASMNQYRPETTSGGLALAFFASQRIRMGKVSLEAKKDPITKEEGVKISCIVYKNRFAGMKNPYTTANYYARFDTGIDNFVEMPALLLEAGIVRQSGAYWYYEDQNKKPYVIDGMECKFPSKAAFLDGLKANKKLYEELNGILSKATGTLTTEQIEQIEKENKEIENQMADIERQNAGDEIEELFGEDSSGQ